MRGPRVRAGELHAVGVAERLCRSASFGGWRWEIETWSHLPFGGAETAGVSGRPFAWPNGFTKHLMTETAMAVLLVGRQCCVSKSAMDRYDARLLPQLLDDILCRKQILEFLRTARREFLRPPCGLWLDQMRTWAGIMRMWTGKLIGGNMDATMQR